MGVTVVTPNHLGYGAAYRFGIAHTQGQFIVMGDADSTYDFLDIPRLLEPLRRGEADIVIGSRYIREIKSGAMPLLHRYIGNPLLTWVFNQANSATLTDTHSGFRAMTRDTYLKIGADLNTDGMEFTTELLEVTIPRGLLLAIGLSIILYFSVAVAAVSTIGWERLAASPAPVADIASETLGPQGALLFTAIALFATANTVLLALISASRITFGMARSGSLPRYLSHVHLTRRTPIYAIAAVALSSLLFLPLNDIHIVASIANFTLFLTFIVINAAVIMLRIKEPHLPRPFRIPFSVGRIPLLPVGGMVVCLFFITQLEPITILIGLVLVIFASAVGATRQLPHRK